LSPAGRSRLSLIRVEGHWLVELPSYGQL